MVSLTDQERRALNEFVSEHWADFVDHCMSYLSPEELSLLEEKLEHASEH